MNLLLSCYCCGSIEFKDLAQQRYTIENKTYLLNEKSKVGKVICLNCQLEDYVENLVITLK